MFSWKSKVHKSGSKVAIFQNDKLVQVINASEDTFRPAEATKFAHEMLEELEYRTACEIDMQDVIPTDTEEKQVDVESKKTPKGDEDEEKELEKFLVDPQGKDLPAGVTEKCDDTEEKNDDEDDEEEKPVIEEEEVVEEKVPEEDVEDMQELFEEPTSIMPDARDKKITELKRLATNLKGLLDKERNDRDIERKARRGLAIAKQEVLNGDLEDDFDVVRARVADIVDLDEKDIEITERKTAGISEFDSPKEALHEARRQRRLARINTIASEEAQHEGDVDEADRLDIVAAKHAEKADKYEKFAAKKKKEDGAKGGDGAKELKEMGYTAKKKKKDDDDDDEEKSAKKKKTPKDDEDEEKELEKYIIEPQGKDLPAGTKGAKLAVKIKTLRAKIADVRLSAEASEALSDTKTADAFDAEADELELQAETLEAEYQEFMKQPDDDEEDMKKDDDEEKAVDDDEEDMKKDDDDEEKAKGDDDDDEEKQVDLMSESSVTLPTEPTKTEASKKKKKDDDDDDEEKSAKKKKKRKGDDDEDEEKKASMIDGFGFDKSAAVVDQGDFSNDNEVSSLEKLWHGKPDDIE